MQHQQPEQRVAPVVAAVLEGEPQPKSAVAADLLPANRTRVVAGKGKRKNTSVNATDLAGPSEEYYAPRKPKA